MSTTSPRHGLLRGLRSYRRSTPSLLFRQCAALMSTADQADGGAPQMIRRHVVGSFIFNLNFDPVLKGPKVALFRRSAQVSTYKNRWAAVSGSVESTDKNPLAAAWRELEEETRLNPLSLRLYRQGKPYSFVDADIGTEWLVHPFAFAIKSELEGGLGEQAIKLDEGHDEWRWFKPADVNSSDAFGAAPLVPESLKRVWFELELGPDASQVLSHGIELLKADHESGARQLASTALEIFLSVLEALGPAPRETWSRQLRTAGWHLWKNGRESMGASILSVVTSALTIVEQRLADLPASAPVPTEELARDIRAFGRRRDDVLPKVSAAFSDWMRQHCTGAAKIRILTMSMSSTVLACLKTAISDLGAQPGTSLDIRILESRPLFEGVSLAATLLEWIHNATPDTRSRVQITVFADAAAAVAACDLDLFLLGADLIQASGAVSAKTGNLPAVLSARHVSPAVRVVVLADREKLMPFAPPEPEANEPFELTRAWAAAHEPTTKTAGAAVGRAMVSNPADAKGAVVEPAISSVSNVYFETIPASLIDVYVLDNGRKETGDISDEADLVRRRADSFFNSL